MRILLVGGTFDDLGGKPSSIVFKMLQEIVNNSDIHSISEVRSLNGGFWSELLDLFNDNLFVKDKLSDFDVVLWFADIPNDKEKIVKNIKNKIQQSILVTSKRNENEEYSFMHLVGRALQTKSNLLLEFQTGEPRRVWMRILDPLGNVFVDSDNIKEVTEALLHRSIELSRYTRIKSYNNIANPPEDLEVPNETEFFEIIKEHAETFHSLIQADNSDRFLGNASFRCERGMPAFRGSDDYIFMSRRNVDKRHIDRDCFVPICLDSNNWFCTEDVIYHGEHKPSVDAPVQVRLFRKYKNIKYIIHGHVYVREYATTTRAIPCGAIEEVNEIMRIIGDFNTSSFAVNLLGHGFVAATDDLNFFRTLTFEKRPIPERI